LGRRARPPVARRARLHIRRGPDAGARAQGLPRTPDRAARALHATRLAAADGPARAALRHSRHARDRGDRRADRRRVRRGQAARRRAAGFLPRGHRGRRRDRRGVPTLRHGAPRGAPGRPPGLRPRHHARKRRGRRAERAARPDRAAQRGAGPGAGAGGARALMRAWKAALLINLALLIGVGWGYLFWGLRAGRLEKDLAAARAAAATVERVVRAILPEINVMVLTHGEMPGYMPAMTMGFRAASPKIHESVRVGDAVRFTVRGVPPNVAVTAIEKAR